MISIRKGVFETNSSSVHALILCTKEDYENLQHGKLLIEPYKNKLITWQEATRQLVDDWGYSWDEVEKMSPEALLDAYYDHDVAVDFDHWGEDYDYFEKEMTTPNGEQIVAFGYSGYNG